MKGAFSNLRARVALLVLLSILPLLALSVYNNLAQRRQAGARAADEAMRLVRLAVGSEEEIVEGARQLLIALSQLPAVHAPVSAPDAGPSQECSALLARIRSQSQRYANLGVVDRSGRLVCSALPFENGVTLDDRSYFQDALRRRTFSAGGFQIGRISGRPSISFGYPILDDGGEPRAVVYASIDLTWLNQLAAAQALAEGVVIFSIDERGDVLTRFPEGERWIGRSLRDEPLVDAILTRGGEGAIESHGFDGAARLYAYAPLDVDGESGVYVGAGIPIEAAYAGANRDLLVNLLTLAALTLLFLSAAWFFADRFVLRPVEGLTRASERLHSGDLGARTGLAHDDGEFGRLAHTFDQMAAALESRLRRLQALSAIDRAITARYDLPQTLEVVLAQVAERLGVDAAAILLLDRGAGALRFAAGRGFRSQNLTTGSLPLDQSYSGRVAQQRRAVYVSHLSQAPDMHAPLKRGEGFISYAGVPLQAEGELLGVLSVYHRLPLPMDEEWQSFLEALALQAAIAIDNARLFRETRRLLQVTQEQARQMQQIVDSLPEGVALLGPDHRLLLANPLASRYLDELAGAAAGDCLHALGGRPLDELLRPLSEDEPWRELTIPQTGQIFELASQPVRRQEHAGGWVLVIRNVTEERERQEYINTQGRLATVGQLAAGIAHDFNNIMSIILLYGQTLARRDDHPRRDEFLETIVDQALRASTLINQILDFSRAGAVERRPLLLAPFLRELIRLLQRTMPESVAIERQVADEEIRVEADPARLQQVLINLAINARDAMSGGGRLRFHLYAVAVAPDESPPLPDMAPGAYACLSVSDTGPGISPENLARIFEPFFTTKPRGEGTGLGLAQVYGIVRQHGGAIDVESHPGEGATFTIYLPRHNPPIAGGGNEQAGVHANGRVAPPAVVLLVEDNEFTRHAIAETLSELGYQVREAQNGRDALARLQRDPHVDLVLTDIVMPEMDGVALQQTLHASHPHIGLLFMSGYPLKREHEQLAQIPHVRTLKKPFTAPDLARNIEKLLQQTRPA